MNIIKNSCINIIHSFAENIDNKNSLTIRCLKNFPIGIIEEFDKINKLIEKSIKIQKNMLNKPIFGIDLVIMGKENYKPKLTNEFDFEELINMVLQENSLEDLSFGLGAVFPIGILKDDIEDNFANIREIMKKYIFDCYEKINLEPYTILSSKIINDELVILKNKNVDEELLSLFEETSMFLLDYVEDLSNGSEIMFINMEENDFIRENFNKVNNLSDLIFDLSSENIENLIKIKLNVKNGFRKGLSNFELNNIENKIKEVSELIMKVIEKNLKLKLK